MASDHEIDDLMHRERMISWENIETFRREFERGHKPALAYALRVIASLGCPMPEWVAVAVRDGVDRMADFELESWDQVFGRVLEKGEQRENAKRNAALRKQIRPMVVRALLADPDVALDDLLFEEIGGQLGIGKTLAKKLFYEIDGSLPSELKAANFRKFAARP